MKALITIVMLVASVTIAAAQDAAMFRSMPTTKDLVDGNGKKTGTATTWAGVTVFRDEKDEILGSSSVTGPNTVTFRDPDGKVTRTMEAKDGKIILRNSAGEIISPTKVPREPK